MTPRPEGPRAANVPATESGSSGPGPTDRVRHVRLPPGAHPQLRVARVRQEVLEFCIRPPEHATEPASIFVVVPAVS